MPLTLVKGAVWNTEGNVYVDLISDLRDAEREGIVYVSGSAAVNDGNGGWFKWEESVPRTAHDGVNTIDPTQTGLGNGCWIRQKFFSAPDGTNFSEVQTATAGQTDFSLKTFLYTPGEGSLAIYVNGTRLTPDAFVEVDSSTVRLISPIKAGDIVEFLGKERPHGGTAIQVQAFQVGYDGTTSGLVSVNVQRALDELTTMIGVGGGGGGGGGATNAAQLVYAPLAPDTSTNVQAGMHWIQNYINDHIIDNAAHKALDISYSPANSKLLSVNVQSAIDEVLGKIINLDPITIKYSGSINATNVYNALEALDQLISDNTDRVRDHLADTTEAHESTAIHFVSNEVVFSGPANVGNALNRLAQQLRQHIHTASAVTYASSAGVAATNVKSALDEVYLALLDHKSLLTAAHSTSAISHSPIAGMGGTTSKQAIDELFANIDAHKKQITGAHAATAISFSGVSNGFQAADVQAAIVEAAGVAGMPYRGHLDLTTVAPAVPTSGQARYTVQTDGALDASWTPITENMPANGQVVAGDTLLFDGTKFHYLPNTAPNQNDLITQVPAAGVNQGIAVAAIGDTALTLESTIAGQQAPVLIVRGGDSQFDNIVSAGTVEDAVGNLRQKAIEVPYDNTLLTGTAPNLGSTDVQHAVDELAGNLYSHANGVFGIQHTAGSIIFTPAGNLVSTNVQSAIEEIDTTLNNIFGGNAALAANQITFDNSVNGFIATDVQAALDEIPRVPLGGAAGTVLAKISATDNDFAWVDEIDLGTF